MFKRLISMSMAMLLAFGMTACNDDDDDKEFEYTDSYMEKLQGSYEELFPVMLESKWDVVWDTLSVKYAGDNAEQLKTSLKESYVAEEYGEEVAAKKMAAGDYTFDCYFENGIKEFCIDGNTISAYDSDGKELSKHEYEAQETKACTEYPQIVFHVYKSKDSNSGEFTYFIFSDDNTSDTYHVEFRYGSDLEALCSYFSGKYGFWLASGIQKNPSDKLVYDVIDLFIKENAGN